MPARRTFVTRIWLFGSIGYGLVRAFLVRRYLSDYGVNAWGFTAVELSSSAVYGWTSIRLVLDTVDSDWRRLRLHGPLAFVSYFAPDAYVFMTAGRMPPDLYATVVTIVVVSALVTALMLSRSLNRARRVRANDR